MFVAIKKWFAQIYRPTSKNNDFSKTCYICSVQDLYTSDTSIL